MFLNHNVLDIPVLRAMIIEGLTQIVNNSRLFSGCIMLLMNLGGRYVAMDVPHTMQSFFAHPWIRRLTIFAIAFVATRDIKTSLLLALAFVLLSKYLMNEKSYCCIVPKGFIPAPPQTPPQKEKTK